MPYNPTKIHRKVRRTLSTSDGQVHSVTRSFTRDDETIYHPIVDTATGYVRCDCRDWEIRCARQEPHVLSDTDDLCKHVIRAILGCLRREEITLPNAHVKALEKAAHRKTRERDKSRAKQNDGQSDSADKPQPQASHWQPTRGHNAPTIYNDDSPYYWDF